MILSSVLTFARTQAQTDTNGLTDEKGIIFANEALSDFHRKLTERGIDAGQIVEASITGTANTGIYPYPTNPVSIIALKAIELNYANTTAQDYKVAHQVDVSNLPNGGFGWLRGNGSTETPNFDDRGNEFEIFPTPTASHNLTALIRMFGFAKPSIMTKSSDSINYPANLDESLLGWRIVASYEYSLGEINKGDAFNAKYEEKVRDYINTLGRGSQQPVQATPIQITGWEY